MEWTKQDLQQLESHLEISRDSQRELYEAMKDIALGGELDHDGQPVMNAEEILARLEEVEALLSRIKGALRQG